MRSSRWLWPGLMLALAAYSAGPEKTYIVEFTSEPAAGAMIRALRADRVRMGDRRVKPRTSRSRCAPSAARR